MSGGDLITILSLGILKSGQCKMKPGPLVFYQKKRLHTLYNNNTILYLQFMFILQYIALSPNSLTRGINVKRKV